MDSTTSEYTAGTYVGGDVLRAGVTSLTESHVCLTVSPFFGLPVFGWCFGLFAFWGGRFFVCVLFGLLTGFPDL